VCAWSKTRGGCLKRQFDLFNQKKGWDTKGEGKQRTAAVRCPARSETALNRKMQRSGEKDMRTKHLVGVEGMEGSALGKGQRSEITISKGGGVTERPSKESVR